MDTTTALSVLRKLDTNRALFVTDEEIFAANDALIDASDFANAARLQTLAKLHPGAIADHH